MVHRCVFVWGEEGGGGGGGAHVHMAALVKYDSALGLVHVMHRLMCTDAVKGGLCWDS